MTPAPPAPEQTALVASGDPRLAVRVFLIDTVDGEVFKAEARIDESDTAMRAVLSQWQP